jgi:NADPH-dependent 2,4-dienoyl-CoA reductase/sulfur reductase-like enzyme
MRRVVILGAGFGGLELATTLSEAVGGDIDVALIDKSDGFVFGYSKLDLMFGRTTPDVVRLPYRDIAKPGVRFLQETIIAIDPEARRVTTDAGVHEAEVLIVALGADYDLDATPGLAEAGNEFYSVAGAERLAEVLPRFSRGRAIIGVCGAPFITAVAAVRRRRRATSAGEQRCAIAHYRGSSICDGYKVGYKIASTSPQEKTKGPRTRAFLSSGGRI